MNLLVLVLVLVVLLKTRCAGWMVIGKWHVYVYEYVKKEECCG